MTFIVGTHLWPLSVVTTYFKVNLLNLKSELYIIIKVMDTIPVINLAIMVIDTIKCCIKLVIDTFYSLSLSCILLSQRS